MLSRDCRMYYEIIHYVCYITICSVSKTIRLNTESDKKKKCCFKIERSGLRAIRLHQIKTNVRQI